MKRIKGAWRVPKFVLVRALETAIEDGRLKLPRNLPAVEVLLKELEAFKVTITPHAHASFGGAGEHDDLVLAAALAVWRAFDRQIGPMKRRDRPVSHQIRAGFVVERP